MELQENDKKQQILKISNLKEKMVKDTLQNKNREILIKKLQKDEFRSEKRKTLDILGKQEEEYRKSILNKIDHENRKTLALKQASEQQMKAMRDMKKQTEI